MTARFSSTFLALIVISLTAGAIYWFADESDHVDTQTTKSEVRNLSPLHQLSKVDPAFTLPERGRVINWPRDHQIKPDFRHEWWYLTANLTSETGRTLALQWTLFRTGVVNRHHIDSTGQPNPAFESWYFAHSALADIDSHYSAFREGRSELQTASVTADPFIASITDWKWTGETADLLPATLSIGDNDWAARLQLTHGANNQYFLQGDAGYSAKHPTKPIASHYYSQPFIEVSGQVQLDGKWQTVTGHAWFDREWGSQLLAPEQQGWDWFSLRLTDDLALMVYQLRSDTSPMLSGMLMWRDGRQQPLLDSDIQLAEIGQRTDLYPQQFQLTIPDHQIDLRVKTINKEQVMKFGIEYFEGMVDVSGSHQGSGFLEMTGYQTPELD